MFSFLFFAISKCLIVLNSLFDGAFVLFCLVLLQKVVDGESAQRVKRGVAATDFGYQRDVRPLGARVYLPVLVVAAAAAATTTITNRRL